MRNSKCEMAARVSFAIRPFPSIPHSTFRISHLGGGAMLSINLRGKRALVAGVADDGGYGFAIAKELAEAGVTAGPGARAPALDLLLHLVERRDNHAQDRQADAGLRALARPGGSFPLRTSTAGGPVGAGWGAGRTSARASVASQPRRRAPEAGRPCGMPGSRRAGGRRA